MTAYPLSVEFSFNPAGLLVVAAVAGVAVVVIAAGVLLALGLRSGPRDR
jgi:hypothetical protein